MSRNILRIVGIRRVLLLGKEHVADEIDQILTGGELSGAAAEAVAAAEGLRDIARVLSITANTDTNIREAMTGILNIADRLERRK